MIEVANSPAGGGGGSAYLYGWDGEIVKSSNESVTSDTTLQNDDTLLIALAEGTYDIELQLIVSSGMGAGGLKHAWAAITNAAAYRTHTTASGISHPAALTTASAILNGTHVIEWMKLVVPAGGGTLQLQWAQSSSSGTATTIAAGSTLRYRQII